MTVTAYKYAVWYRAEDGVEVLTGRFVTAHDVSIYLWGRDLRRYNVYQLRPGLPTEITDLQRVLERTEVIDGT